MFYFDRNCLLAEFLIAVLAKVAELVTVHRDSLRRSNAKSVSLGNVPIISDSCPFGSAAGGNKLSVCVYLLDWTASPRGRRVLSVEMGALGALISVYSKSFANLMCTL